MTSPTLKICLEFLYHYNCGNCAKWWSVADITPTIGSKIHCPHCGTAHEIPQGAQVELSGKMQAPPTMTSLEPVEQQGGLG